MIFACDYGLIYWGEQFLDSGLTAILFALLPSITSGSRTSTCRAIGSPHRTLAGTLLAFVGVVALFGEGVPRSCRSLARCSPSLAGPSVPRQPVSRASVMAARCTPRSQRSSHAVGGVTLAVTALATRRRTRLPSDADWTAIAYLAIAGSVVTFLVYFSLLRTGR